MPGPLLYSTNVRLKLHVQETWRGDIHYVWCSEYFDPRRGNPYTAGSLLPPSSSPAEIYRQLVSDVRGGDTHSAKIDQQRASLISLATLWHSKGEITDADRDDIIYLAREGGPLSQFTPLIYVIPRANIDPTRLRRVPASKSAGMGPEYVIADLKRSEFDIIEPHA